MPTEAGDWYLDEFHDEVDVGSRLVFLVESDDVDVVAPFHDRYLILDHVNLARQLRLVNHLITIGTQERIKKWQVQRTD